MNVNDLPTYLRAAADEPPPTTIDLDALIAGERRRSRTVRLATFGGGIVAVTALIVGVTLSAGSLVGGVLHAGAPPGTATPGDPSNEPTADVGSDEPVPCGVVIIAPKGVYQSFTGTRPDPAEPPGQIARRMSEALDTALVARLPKDTAIRDLGHTSGCDRRQFVYDPQRREYNLPLAITTPAGTARLFVLVMPKTADWDRCYVTPPDAMCQRHELRGGGQYASDTMVAGSEVRHTVTVFRADDTMVSMQVTNFDLNNRPVAGSQPPLSIEQLVELGQTPGLTLYT
jgi:hypothetical protein